MPDTLTLRPDTWLSLVQEEIVDPARPIIDPHHHLWEQPLRWAKRSSSLGPRGRAKA